MRKPSSKVGGVVLICVGVVIGALGFYGLIQGLYGLFDSLKPAPTGSTQLVSQNDPHVAVLREARNFLTMLGYEKNYSSVVCSIADITLDGYSSCTVRLEQKRLDIPEMVPFRIECVAFPKEMAGCRLPTQDIIIIQPQTAPNPSWTIATP